MRPEEFGPFLTEERKKQSMTQTELAEALHVSTAAVSKWERGKCLPEVSKLEDIAQVLGISVLEVMQCRISPKPVAVAEVRETYSQTADLSQKQHEVKTARLAVVMILLLAAVALWAVLREHPIWHIGEVWSPSYFTTGEISLLTNAGSWEDRTIARGVLALAEEAFCDITTPRAEQEEKYGLLARYATEGERGAVDEWHSLELWAAEFHLMDGTMWVYYSQEAYNEKGETICGSWRIPSLWYLEKNGKGEWVVTGIKEHP